MKSFANGNGNSAGGPWTPGKRTQYGYPPPGTSIYTLTGWEAPE